MEAAIRRFLSGYGDGDGDGYGDGDDDGYGYGDGDGYGDGSGYGSGSGSGSGYGYGYGYGSGYGEKLKRHNGKIVYYVDSVPCAFVSVHDTWAVVDTISRDDFSTARAFIARQDGCFAHGKTIKEAFAAVLEKVMDNMDDDEKKRRFLESFPEYETPYKTLDFFSWHHVVTGSCDFGRRQFAQEHGLDLDGEMTVRQFIELTRGSYRGEQVSALEELYR